VSAERRELGRAHDQVADGLAGSVDRLFQDLERGLLHAEPTARPHAPAPTPAREVDQRRSVDALSETLEQLVGRYLSASETERAELEMWIDALGRQLARSDELHPILAAVERLALAVDAPHGAPVDLAKKLVTPEVARGMAVMLGAASRDEARRARIAAAVVRVGAPMVPALADVLTESTERPARRLYIETLSAMGDAALPAVRRLVEDPRWFVVRNAILVLRGRADASALEPLTAALGHPDARVRKEALLALAHVGGESAAQLAASKLSDPDVDVRRAAAMVTGALASVRALKPLLERLDDEKDPDVQETILLALGQIGDPGAVPAIEKRAVPGLFTRAQSSLRVAAYRALAAIGTPHARELLSQAADDRDPVVRDAVSQLVRGG
jgi:hypothetical protein